MVAASSSSDARGGLSPERFRLLRELGTRVVPAWAALEALPEGRTKVVVLERVTRGGAYGDQEVADWVRDARRLATLEHPNVARVRDVVIRGDEVMVASDFVDGARWSELAGSAQRASLEVALRVLVDVLSGLSAVHNLRDAKREPLKLVHGELTPECVVVGLDGVARIVSACRPKSATAQPGRSACGYLAPEVLLADESADARADVYSVGVLLWEALSGRPLFHNAQPSAIVTQLLSGRVARASVPVGAPWAEPLVDVSARALSADPEKRFASAAALAAELRRVAGQKLATPIRVAAFIRGAFGDTITERKEQLERGEVRAREVSGVEPPPVDEIPVEFVERPSGLPTPVPPSLRSTKPPPPFEPAPQAAVATERAAPQAAAAVPPRGPPGPPPVPKPRGRLSTLAGVAPQAELRAEAEVGASPVVVPSSSRPPPPPIAPPTPLVAFVPPRDALVPSDLAAQVKAFPLAPPLPAPIATPIADVREDVVLPKNRSRALAVALLAAPLVLVVAVLGWWRASSGSPSPTRSPTTVAAATSATARAAGTSETEPAAAPSTAVTSAERTPSPATAASADSPAPHATRAPGVAPTFATPTGWATPAPPRPGKRKYEPEGI
jgi:serine/threonine-protein kinase